jgi:probable rRNA maturation factor
MTEIDLVIEDDRWVQLPLLTLATRAVDAAIAATGAPDGYEVALLACDDARIAELNAEFRGKPTPTNVLSWPAFDLAPLQPGDTPGGLPEASGFDDTLGDIALAYDTCVREARAQGKTVEDHVTHLILHGTFHLLGFDHETEADAHRMETLESQTLAEMGIRDPYRDMSGA